MRSFTTDIGDEASKHPLLELQQIGRREVMGHQNQRHIHGVAEQQVLLRALSVAARRWRRHSRACALHGAQHFLGDLFEIGLAFAQVGILHFVKLARDDVELRGQRPFGVVKTLGNPAFDASDEFIIIEQQQMHIQQGRELLGRLLGSHLGNGELQPLDFLNHGIAADANPINLGVDLRGCHKVVRDIHPA